ncbi:hypothetical protein [Polyangium sp. y55x31]|uniref:hypothetical protein n=1 Tax=Polyangium sp. y55x31 TaxID=3042688 RepID=UPI0024827C99|nr:hypothetical protein [Polyangium sp. y55x31]MDI1478526.1 hypothetical protein [Polyangium sp. y55x31]
MRKMQSTTPARLHEEREHRLTVALSVAFAALAFLACKQGERASAKGQCPPGETCSDRTPEGLNFIGAHTVNDADTADLLPTAIGGTQTVTLYYAGSPNVPYVAGFEARPVDSTIATLESQSLSELVLQGATEGKTLLRVVEPGTNALLDRVEIKTAAVARISVIPRELRYETVTPTQWAVLAGNPADLGVLLFDANNVQVIDETLDVRAHGAEISRRTWDRREVTAPSEGSLTLMVRAGDHREPVEVQVVSSVKDITRKPQDSTEQPGPIEIQVGAAAETFCFLAKSDDKTVVGAPWGFEPSENLSIARPSPPSDTHPWDAPFWSPPSCVALAGAKVGTATLKVKAGDSDKVFEVSIRE